MCLDILYLKWVHNLKRVLEQYKRLPIHAKASIWFLICSVIQKGVSLITTPIFTRLMPTSDYGTYGVFVSWLGIATVFITFNLHSGVFAQGLVKFEDDKNRFIASLQGLSFFLFVIWLIILMSKPDFWRKTLSLNVVQLYAMLILAFTSSIYGFWALTKRVNLEYRTLVVMTAVVTVLKPLLGVFAVLHFDDKATARIVSMAIVESVAFFFIFTRQISKGKNIIDIKYWKYALFFNIPLIPHYLSMTLLNSADRIMIKSICDSSKAGIYNLAYSVGQIMIIINSALLQTIEPWLYKKIKHGQISDLHKIAYSTFTLVAVSNFTIIIFAPEIIKIFAPMEYYDAIWIIPPIAISVFFMYTYSFFAVFEFYFEKTKLIATATTIGALANLIMNYYFINKYGYYAAGYTTLVCYVFFAIFHYYFMKKICNEKYKGFKVYNSWIIALISIVFSSVSLLVMLLYNYTLLRYIIIVAFFALTFVFKSTIITAVKDIIRAGKEKVES